MRRGMRRRRVSRKTHSFKRTLQFTPISAPAGVMFYYAYQFQLNQLTNFTEFTNLFDNYRVNKLLLKFVPRSTVNQQTGNAFLGEFISVIDYNDVVTPSSSAQLMEMDTHRKTTGFRTHARMWTPSVLTPQYSVGGSGSFVSNPRFKQWINSSNPDISHYGFKMSYDNTSNVAPVVWNVFLTAYMSFKNVK